MFSKGGNFHDLFASLDALLKSSLLLTLLDSEKQKLYTVLAFLSAIGLKEKHFST